MHPRLLTHPCGCTGNKSTNDQSLAGFTTVAVAAETAADEGDAPAADDESSGAQLAEGSLITRDDADALEPAGGQRSASD